LEPELKWLAAGRGRGDRRQDVRDFFLGSSRILVGDLRRFQSLGRPMVNIFGSSLFGVGSAR
jgi:hypothetical protein